MRQRAHSLQLRCRAAMAAAFVMGMLGLPAATQAQDRWAVDGMLDVRAVHVDGIPSYLVGGLGRLRYDEDHDGLRLGRAFADLRYRMGDTLTVNAVVGSYGDSDKHPVDLTEFWLQWRPFPVGPIRYQVKAGAFYSPISLENRDIGWTTPYSLTPSAINTWFGQEIRTIGAEGEARWIGRQSGYDGELAAVAGLYGWDDPAGEVLADEGWALHDRQTNLFGGIGRPRAAVFREIDGRPGVYGGLSWRHHDQLEVRLLRYDNRADPGATNNGAAAWRTQFTSAGLRFEPNEHWTLIAQNLQGQTYVGADQMPARQFAMGFRSWFTLGSFNVSQERFSIRYDHFSTHQRSGFSGLPDDDDGHALMLAWLHDFDAHWQIVGEWQRIHSNFPPRVNVGAPEQLTETQLQLAVRYRFALRR